MLYYLIVCRSLTQAQQTRLSLNRAGIVVQLLRSPGTILRDGCSYCVKLSEKNLAEALKVLSQTNFSPRRIFLQEGNGSYQEVLL